MGGAYVNISEGWGGHFVCNEDLFIVGHRATVPNVPPDDSALAVRCDWSTHWTVPCCETVLFLPDFVE